MLSLYIQKKMLQFQRHIYHSYQLEIDHDIDYSKFVDNQPTKFVTSLKDTKTNSTKFDKAVAKPEETSEPEIETAEEEQKVEHKPSYYRSE